MIERILLVTRIFPPSANPEALCTGKLAFALAEAGVKVTVVTLEGNEPKRPVDAAYLAHQRVSVVRIPGCTVRGALKVASYLRSWWAVRTSLSDAFSVEALAEGARARLKEERFDLIYARGLPAAGFLAGCLAAETSGVPWMCHLSDPWPRFLLPEPYRRQFFRVRNLWEERRWLRRVARTAMGISVPSQKMAGYLRGRSAEYTRSKFIVVPHVSLQPTNGSSAEGKPKPAPRTTLRIVYTGNIDSSRDVRPLFRAVKQVLHDSPNGIELTFMVFDARPILSLSQQYGLGSAVRCIDPSSYQDAQRLAAEADALLLIEANTAEGVFLPSKFVDYCSTGRPILALTPDDSEVSRYLNEGGGVGVPPNDVGKIADALARLCGDLCVGRINDLSSDRLLERFAPARVVTGFIRAVEELLESRQTAA
ncbi:MAG TPA: glycosyltransferase [Thermoanaerobaculaceae bacterium]|nr:glycosyltransferase [Thermoanaerobaculaceae bacterium]